MLVGEIEQLLVCVCVIVRDGVYVAVGVVVGV